MILQNHQKIIFAFSHNKLSTALLSLLAAMMHQKGAQEHLFGALRRQKDAAMRLFAASAYCFAVCTRLGDYTAK